MIYEVTLSLSIEADSPLDAAEQAEGMASDPQRETFGWRIVDESGTEVFIDVADFEAEDISYKYDEIA